MTDYVTTIKRLEDMRASFDAGFSTSEREFLTDLNLQLFGKVITLTGCCDCYRDAYLIIYNKLKHDKKMPQQTAYRLRPGVVIHEFGTSEYYAFDVSDEVAENYLKKDKANIKYFERYPENWEERLTIKIAADAVKSLGTDNVPSDDKETVKSNKKTRSRKESK